MKNIIRAHAALMAAFVLACSAPAQNDIDLTGYTLTFGDEFDTLSATSSSPKGASKWYTGYPPNGSAGVYGYAKDTASCLSISNGVLINKLKLATVVGSTGSFCAGPVGMKTSSGTAMVNVGTLGTQVRNHSSWQWYGWAGMKFTVGSNPVTISQLGRYAISANTQKHQVRVFHATTGADVAKAIVDCKGQTGFVYANIDGGNKTLAANTSYFLLTDNYDDGDYFYNSNTSVTATGGITVNDSRWGAWQAGAMFSVDATAAGFSQKYGYFAIRAKMPSSGTGSWPSFWMKTLNDISNVGSYLEVDVLEWYGNNYSDSPQKAVMQQASHNWNPDGSQSDPPKHLYSPFTPMPGTNAYPWAGYHIYGFKSDPINCTWYIDGVQTNQIPTPANYLVDPLWVLLEYNIGGKWPLTGLVANSQLEIDWLRAYSLPPNGAPTVSTNFVPGPAKQNVSGTNFGLAANKPNGTWIWGGGWNWGAPYIPATWDSPAPLNVVRLAEEKTALGLTLASSGSYTKPTQFSISADLCIHSGSAGGGLGFWSAMPARVDGVSPLSAFTGFVLKGNGDLQLYANGATVGAAQPTQAITLGTYYKLSYNVNTTTGAISQVTFNGISKTFTSTAFTNAATAFAGVLSHGGARVSMRNLSIQ